MRTHPTLDKLQTLKLSGMYHALVEQLQMADIAALSFEEHFGLLVDREITERDNRRLSTRVAMHHSHASTAVVRDSPLLGQSAATAIGCGRNRNDADVGKALEACDLSVHYVVDISCCQVHLW